MIYLYQNNSEYDYDVRAIALAFFEREKIKEVDREEFSAELTQGEHQKEWITDAQSGQEHKKERITGAQSGQEHKKERITGAQSGQEHHKEPENRLLFLELDFGDARIDGKIRDACGHFHEEAAECDYSDHVKCRNDVCRFLYRLFSGFTKRSLPWGMLTGIRPTKIPMKWLEEGMAPEEITRRFQETYLADEQKASLVLKVADKERKILESHPFSEEYSLYIGIPFCPTTCLYCSFTSFPVSRYRDRMDPYLTALEKELAFVADAYKDKPLTTIYVGGGTPTALDEPGLSRLMEMIHQHFPVADLGEFTVEAGRPDSVNAEKFSILKDAGVGRISINPQTMHQRTLDLIGRNHTVEQVRQAFYMGRKAGFSCINMDMITGLPGEDIEDVRETLLQLRQLEPENLTVHSLAIKRAAHLNIEMERYRSMVRGSTNDMLRLVDETCADMGMEPYYMYRQKNIPGNLENIGYSLPGKECLYNILIMEEKQDIISCGAGGSTKYVYPAENRIERTENVKNIDHYIERIDEMIDRKKNALRKH